MPIVCLCAIIAVCVCWNTCTIHAQHCDTHTRAQTNARSLARETVRTNATCDCACGNQMFVNGQVCQRLARVCVCVERGHITSFGALRNASARVCARSRMCSLRLSGSVEIKCSLCCVCDNACIFVFGLRPSSMPRPTRCSNSRK